jgi:nucleoid-associated protein EbfC
MNMQNLMAQAQKMQKDIMKKKEEINEEIFPGKSELVDIEMNGKKQIISVNIKNKENLSIDDMEILQDMIMIAVNDAGNKVDKATQDAMGAYGNAFNGLL